MALLEVGNKGLQDLSVVATLGVGGFGRVELASSLLAYLTNFIDSLKIISLLIKINILFSKTAP